MPISINEAKKLIKFAKKQGLKSFKMDGFEFECQPDDVILLPDHGHNGDADSVMPSDEDMLLYSTPFFEPKKDKAN